VVLVPALPASERLFCMLTSCSSLLPVLRKNVVEGALGAKGWKNGRRKVGGPEEGVRYAP
jgi:hypothetical protein